MGWPLLEASYYQYTKSGRKVAQMLLHLFHNKQSFDTMEELAISIMGVSRPANGPVTIVSLVDLDKLYLRDVTVGKTAALKTVREVTGIVV